MLRNGSCFFEEYDEDNDVNNGNSYGEDGSKGTCCTYEHKEHNITDDEMDDSPQRQLRIFQFSLDVSDFLFDFLLLDDIGTNIFEGILFLLIFFLVFLFIESRCQAEGKLKCAGILYPHQHGVFSGCRRNTVGRIDRPE